MTDYRDTPCLAKQTLASTATKISGISVMVRKPKQTAVERVTEIIDVWKCSYRSISVHQRTSPSSSPSTLTGMRAFLVCLMEFILVVIVRSLVN